MTAIAKRERLKQERREAIVSAAVRVFLSRGVQAATMDEIAREAGVSKGTLYLYFKSKDELFLTIALEWLDEMQVEIDRIKTAGLEPGIEMVRAGAKAYVRHALESRARFQVAMSWMVSAYSVDSATPLFEKYKAAIAEKHEFMIGAFERAKTDGSITSPEPSLRLGMQLWGALFGLVLVEQNSEELARRMPATPPTQGICNAMIDNFLSALSAQRASSQLRAVSPEEH